MLEDKLLIWKLKNGSADAMLRIYEKHKDSLLALALTLSGDRTIAEDSLHDVFVNLAQYAPKLKLRTTLKSYLSASIANRIRNIQRTDKLQSAGLDIVEPLGSNHNSPEQIALQAEQIQRIKNAVARLPYEQREVVILHLQAGLKFRQIATEKDVSVNTIQSRYKYALQKLRSLLNHEAEK